MTSTDTVTWLLKEMHGACKIGLPLVGCTGWPNPVTADPPELTRTLNETDLRRAVGLARRRGIPSAAITAAWTAAKSPRLDPSTSASIAKFIDRLDNLPPGHYPAGHPLI